MQLTQLLKDIKVYETNGEIDAIDVKSLAMDNRKCKEGSAFFAIRGLVTDGHKYIESAMQNGAIVVFVEEFTCDPVLQVKVKDTRAVMSLVAAAFYEHPAHKMRFLGVTGTNGKTSITFMLKIALEMHGEVVGVIGTSGIYLGDNKLNIGITTSTTPDPIELQYILLRLVTGGATIVVMEVTAQALHLRKMEDIYFDAGIFTNLTQDHLEFFGTMEVYAAAKKRLFASSCTKLAVINIDDAIGAEIVQETDCELLTYSATQPADLFADEIRLHAQKCNYILVYQGQRLPVTLNITGLFNIYNSLGAVGALLAYGLTAEQAVQAIDAYSGTPGRFETPEMKGAPYSVVIDYAHTPDGLENILKTVVGYKKGRLITVFGCGGNRDTQKRPIMGAISARYSDLSVITSDNPRFEDKDVIISEIISGIPEGTAFVAMENRYNAIKYAMQTARKDDIIVIAGKGDEDYQEINGVKHHFSDRETVALLLDILK